MPIYTDPDTGQGIFTHSMGKSMRRCPNQFRYKYIERLKPKVQGRPLREGTWMHKLLETHYKGGDWKTAHKILTAKFDKMFEEERVDMPTLPDDCYRLMQSYLWHYKNDDWEVLEVEFVVECELPNGLIYRGRIDMLVREKHTGFIYIVDHKFNARMPDPVQNILDAASGLYIWAARRMGIEVQGFIWNRVRRKAPAIPQLLKDGSRLSQKVTDYDYPTLYRALRKYGLDLEPYMDRLKYLKSLRYEPGGIQKSTFFQRQTLEKNDDMLKQIAREMLHTSRRAEEYPWDKLEYVERCPDRSCDWCNYNLLCAMELFRGHDQAMLRRQRYTLADPMEYYYDDPKEREEVGR